jgi:hypothetical protein
VTWRIRSDLRGCRCRQKGPAWIGHSPVAWLPFDYQSPLETLAALSVHRRVEKRQSRWQRFKGWLHRTPKEEDPAKKKEAPEAAVTEGGHKSARDARLRSRVRSRRTCTRRVRREEVLTPPPSFIGIAKEPRTAPPFFSSLSARFWSWVYTGSANATFVQAIHHQTDVSQTKQALYKLFAAYVHTIPLEELIESVERTRLDAKLRYVAIYGAAYSYCLARAQRLEGSYSRTFALERKEGRKWLSNAFSMRWVSCALESPLMTVSYEWPRARSSGLS